MLPPVKPGPLGKVLAPSTSPLLPCQVDRAVSAFPELFQNEGRVEGGAAQRCDTNEAPPPTTAAGIILMPPSAPAWSPQLPLAPSPFSLHLMRPPGSSPKLSDLLMPLLGSENFCGLLTLWEDSPVCRLALLLPATWGYSALQLWCVQTERCIVGPEHTLDLKILYKNKCKIIH